MILKEDVYDIFVALYNKYMRHYGLYEWSYNIQIGHKMDLKDMAISDMDMTSMNVMVIVNIDYKWQNKEEVEKVVKHEIGHLLVYPLCNKDLSEPTRMSNEEAYCNRMEILLKDLDNNI